MENAVESQATPEQQSAAEKMGWIPPTRFKGDPERFIDAQEYLERGETILPIVKEHNKRLQTELEMVRAESQKTAAALKAAQTAIEQIEERHSVATQKAVEDARKQVKAQLAAASEAGDHEGIAELTDQLVLLNKAEEGTEKKEVVKAPAPTFTSDPALIAWNVDNPWFGKDKRKTSLALGIAQELRENGERSIGRVFYDKVAAEVEVTLAPKEPKDPPTDKVEGARSGHEEEGVSRNKKSYTALPSDARAACDADAKRFVGAGKRYKTVQEWRNRYAELYFGE